MDKKISLLRVLGVVLVIGGLFAGVYYLVFFDTSVEVPQREILGSVYGGGRVNNLGLMNDRQNGIYLGFGAAVVGLACLGFESRNRKKA